MPLAVEVRNGVGSGQTPYCRKEGCTMMSLECASQLHSPSLTTIVHERLHTRDCPRMPRAFHECVMLDIKGVFNSTVIQRYPLYQRHRVWRERRDPPGEVVDKGIQLAERHCSIDHPETFSGRAVKITAAKH